MQNKPAKISVDERQRRIELLRGEMDRDGVAAVILGPTTNLRYFAGIAWHPSERFTGAVVTAKAITYICPGFERDKVQSFVTVPGDIRVWQEHESPYALIADAAGQGSFALDEQVALFTYYGLRKAVGDERLKSAGGLTNSLRRIKSDAELALMQHAKNVTLEAQRRARDLLRPGILVSEVVRFIDETHRKFGSDGGNTFCLVSFAEDTTLPHGGEGERALKDGDMVLIDTGCAFDGYNSDITRSYVFGEPTKRQREIWTLEKEAQAAAFTAAELGQPCEAADRAARIVLERTGLGPDYRLPGLPHRTGHGIGLDVHESPNLVRGDKTPLAPGMCFSNEPMIVLPGEFGIRLEDHFYLTESGPRWFTQPSHSIDAPFDGVAALAD
ncbi:MAG TPA: Xaa-Pro peptidase family protein [Rhizomicrobium sp.]|jgi:Xaa-Pro dipeptidase|nr:Xaa-Pro peptidase family protein [Rhizomicrobium sp.]